MNNILNVINEILDCPKLYLIEYYDDLKTKIDIHFVIKLQSVQDIQLKEEISKQSVKFIDIIDKCFAKCISNTIPSELISEVKELLSQIEQKKNLIGQLERMKLMLQSHLFANDSYLAVYLPQINKVYLIEEGFDPIRVECFLKTSYKLYEIMHQTSYALSINNMRKQEKNNKSFEVFHSISTKVVKLKFKAKTETPKIKCSHPDALNLRAYSNLKYLRIYNANINESTIFGNLIHLERLNINQSKINSFDSIWFKCENLTHLSVTNCQINNLKKDCLVNLVYLEQLNLNKNKNLCLEEGCFNGLNRLKKLNLSECSIICELKENFFYELNSLEWLNFRKSSKLFLRTGCFNGLNQLKKLDLSKCSILELEQNVLLGLNFLENLVLDNYYISLQFGCFNGLSRIISRYKSKHETFVLELRENCFYGINSLCLFDSETLYFRECKNFQLENKNLLTLELNSLEYTNLKINYHMISTESLSFDGLNQVKKITLSSQKNFKYEKFEYINLNNHHKPYLFRDDRLNGLDQIATLDISNHENVLELKENVFIGLMNLKFLDLRNSSALILRTGCFNGLNRLKKLDLSSNKNLELIENVFLGLESLESLYLNNCQGILLKGGCFNGLNRLKKLDLSLNKNLELIENVFLGLESLESLYLNNCQGILLKGGCFNGLTLLKELVLHACCISEFNKNLFIELINLKKLKISYNRRILLKADCFNGLIRLKELDISNCGNLELIENVFLGLNSLECIDFTNNQGMLLRDGCFNGLTQLKELVLYHQHIIGSTENLMQNKILELKENIFLALTSLEILYLNNNKDYLLREGCFNGLIQLKKLSLFKSNISELNENMFLRLESLKSLDLSNNCDVLLRNGCFNGLSNLKELNLSVCNISELNENVFLQLENLEKLELGHNKNVLLRDGCFNGLVNLKELNLSVCNISELNENVFLGLKSLEKLNLGNNWGISLRDGCFNGLTQLKNLDFYNCKLEKWNENALIGLNNLELLDMRFNGIYNRCLNGLNSTLYIRLY